jgi:membrane associated rhomboid family serine protease
VYGRGYGTPGFGPAFTPPIVQQLLIANIAVFLAQVLFPPLSDLTALSPRRVFQSGFLWQPFTYMWLHGGLLHLALNMFVLWMFGSQMAMAWGPRRFLRYYLVCGVGAGVIIATVPYVLVGLGIAPAYTLNIPTVGASGAIYGLLLAYSLTWPDRTIMLIFPPVAFRAIWLIPILFFTSIAFGGGNVSHVGHLGGVVVGWLYLRHEGHGAAQQPLFTWEQLKYRWRRYRMRRRLKAVQYQEWEAKRREHDRRYH